MEEAKCVCVCGCARIPKNISPAVSRDGSVLFWLLNSKQKSFPWSHQSDAPSLDDRDGFQVTNNLMFPSRNLYEKYKSLRFGDAIKGQSTVLPAWLSIDFD